MRVLEYSDLDASRVKKQYDRVVAQLERGDFRSAEVKKLEGRGLFRAKLDDTNRLLFKIVNHQGERCLLLLEVVHNHAYDKSRFLRGASIDEDKIPTITDASMGDEATATASDELRYVNPESRRIHILDRILSFDPEQDSVFSTRPPLIIIGAAGSGKTALTLEKLKLASGRALYVTLSAYLAEHARALYYGHNYENAEQEVDFLSLREYLEIWRVPPGKEVSYRAFADWCSRFPKAQRVGDAHALFEEFRGVITGSAIDCPHLSAEQYASLGVRQSIFLDDERPRVYALFERYLAYLRESGRFDPNIVAHGHLQLVAPIYDFVVVDEVQDITNVQLELVLKSLKSPGSFVLCGDANQVVHPNFFSWSALKSMFYNSRAVPSEQAEVQRVLHCNYRNSPAVTGAANQLLRAKQKRFGSIDRESNYLVRSALGEGGRVELLRDSEATRADLDQKTRRSNRFAVIVMRDEQKAEARRSFKTPLLFSVHEAKGLEYENIILVGFVSADRAAFTEIAGDLTPEQLQGDLVYGRARDKTDKSLQAYKFFINALYVAITRATQSVFMLEEDTAHPLLRLMGLSVTRDRAEVAAQQSTREDWQAEAHRLEMQGKQEQADEIRREILNEKRVPWEVLAPEQVLALADKALAGPAISQKPRQTLFEYALFYDLPAVVARLAERGFERARGASVASLMARGYYAVDADKYAGQRAGVMRKHLAPYQGRHFSETLRACDDYGVDHRTTFNRTPLMLAAHAGNVALVDALLGRGADAGLADSHGLTAWHIALGEAFLDERFAAQQLPALHERLAPASVSLKVEDRLVKLDSHTGEFLLFQTFFVLLRRKLGGDTFWFREGFATADLLEPISKLPAGIVPEYRRRREYLSGVLSRNEIRSRAPNSRRIFVRVRTGHYLFDPRLAVRVGEAWVPIYELTNPALIAQLAGARWDEVLARLDARVQATPTPET